MVILGLVNLEFHRCYGTPISPVIFGLMQDDTGAIVTQILRDWPVARYALLLATLIALPALAARLIPADGAPLRAVAGSIALSVAFALAMRGTLDTFPLRQQHLGVSPHLFINQCVQNGAFSLYEAWKGQKALDFSDGELAEVKRLGFRGIDEVDAILQERPAGRSERPAKAPARRPHVFLAIMEAMGRDEFESHVPGRNDMLGALAGELHDAWIFRNGLTIGSGTFPAVEGLLFDSPYTPLSQSRYGHEPFPFSKVLPFREAGYRVVYLTGGEASWRGLNETLPLHGFDEVLGAANIHEAFPEAQPGTWGVGDEWMFRFAARLLKETDAAPDGRPLLLVMLSTTNHGPHRVPDGRPSLPVDPDALPAVVVRDKTREEFSAQLQTYQYAANWLGWFVGELRRSDVLGHALVATTGDHNARFTYPPSGAWHHHLGIPFLVWAPEEIRRAAGDVDTSIWATQRDLFSTLAALALGREPLPEEGRNLTNPSRDFAYGYFGIAENGFAIGPEGAVAVNDSGELSCLQMQGDTLEGAPCSAELERMGRFSAAQRAKVDWVIRSSLLHKTDGSGK